MDKQCECFIKGKGHHVLKIWIQGEEHALRSEASSKDGDNFLDFVPLCERAEELLEEEARQRESEQVNHA